MCVFGMACLSLIEIISSSRRGESRSGSSYCNKSLPWLSWTSPGENRPRAVCVCCHIKGKDNDDLGTQRLRVWWKILLVRETQILHPNRYFKSRISAALTGSDQPAALMWCPQRMEIGRHYYLIPQWGFVTKVCLTSLELFTGFS